VLYLMMAVAAWLVWRRSSFRMDRIPLAVFAVQLALNSLWSVLFFGMRQPGLAAAEILLLLAMILATVVVFWRRSPVAGLLLVPYLMWVCFASILNLSIWQLNQ
jgi:benzodiazapine receptor